jgi:endo-1,4-beta-mannosidase
MRKNTITNVTYMDDPTILAWELINEPYCHSDPSGNTLQVLTLLSICYSYTFVSFYFSCFNT